MTGKGSSQSGSAVDVVPSGWWADEMLGRLARYLRIVGLDTAYVPGLDDEELLRRSRGERRVLITRDRALARRAEGSILLTQMQLEGQWREMRARFPRLPCEPRFERCTVCNGRLAPLTDPERASLGEEVPRPVRVSTVTLFRCGTCGHIYWEGSHTASVRRRLLAWSLESSP